MTTPKDLARWYEDAHDALDEGRPLTIDHIWALVATPDGAKKVGETRTTWWSEELARVAQQKCRDAYPANGTNDDVAAWLRRQEHYEVQLESLADAHADAIARAHPDGARPIQSARPPKPTRRTAASLSLDASREDAA